MFDRLASMFDTVASQGHGSIVTVLSIGVVFGMLLQYSRVVKFEKIAGFAMLRDTIVPKMILLAVGLASIALYFMVEAGYAEYHVKPLNLGGILIGGVLFGAAMAVFGKCPGTGPVSIAEGRIDVLVGAVGGILGGLFFVVYYDFFKGLMGPDLGKMTLMQWFEGYETVVILVFGLFVTALAILIPLRDEPDEAEDALQDGNET
jgi:hypothetical protein